MDLVADLSVLDINPRLDLGQGLDLHKVLDLVVEDDLDEDLLGLVVDSFELHFELEEADGIIVVDQVVEVDLAATELVDLEVNRQNLGDAFELALTLISDEVEGKGDLEVGLVLNVDGLQVGWHSKEALFILHSQVHAGFLGLVEHSLAILGVHLLVDCGPRGLEGNWSSWELLELIRELEELDSVEL